ncbi:MAG: undecaprenyl-diphosphatase UppP [Candidatus Omnitrophica bacterium]|nr:undecaprenyl-diphosphatase UppP [Candidatus Omnitrophota bacterium]
MDYFNAIILGVVEGITEFLPISSTGHLILTSKILHLTETEFLKSFEIAIQLGAILSVVVLYWRMLLVNKNILKQLTVAFIPTAVIGFGLYKIVKKFFLGNSDIVIWALFLGGIFLVIFELVHKENNAKDIEKLEDINLKQSFIIGIFQSFAIIPGVSRAAATIIGGLILGLKRQTIVEFSFLLAVPTMGAAVAYDLIKSAPAFSSDQFIFLIIGFVVSFIVAIGAIKFLLAFIQKNNFVAFGFYRILLAILFMFFIKL